MHAKQQPQNSLNQLGCLYFVMAAWVSQGLRHFKSNAVVVLKAVLEVCARGESAVFLLLKRVRRFVFLLLLLFPFLCDRSFRKGFVFCTLVERP